MSIAAIIAICIAVGFGIGSGTAAGMSRARSQMQCLERATDNGLNTRTAHRVCSRRGYRAGRV